MGAILYPIFGCWVWGGGWMSQLGNDDGLGHGYVDFAGSTVVHAVGGFCAMALAVVLGSAARKVWAGRQAARVSGPQSRVRRDRHVHSAVRLDGIQSRARRLAPRICAFPWSRSTRTSRPFSDRRRRCSSGTSCSANRTSRWPATACWRDWSPSRLPAPSSVRTPRSSSASSPESSSASASSSMSAC